MRQRRRLRWAALAGFGVIAVLFVWLALRLPVAEPDEGQVRVERVLDGDTIKVRRGSAELTVRLLNINTPETVDPDKPPECGGAQASDWLKQRLPEGEPLVLTYDIERTDRYGRELARVATSDGRVINDEIAANGLGRAIVIGANHTFYAQVKAAEEAARQAGRGLFDPVSGCPEPRAEPRAGPRVAARADGVP